MKIETYDPDNGFTAIAKLIAGKLDHGVVRPLDTVAQAVKDPVGDTGKIEVVERKG